VVTSTLVHEGDGRWREYEGGVEDWLRQSQRAAAMAKSTAAAAAKSAAAAPATSAPAPAVAAPAAAPAKRKLSYKEQRELDELPKRIDALEAEQKLLTEQLSGTELYSQGAARVTEVQARSAQIEETLLELLERWETLSAR